MKVLIICNDFPPVNSVGAHRPYSWHKYFIKYGIDSIVVTKNQDSKNKFLQTDLKVERNDFGEIVRVPTKNILPEMMLKKYGINKYSGFRKAFTLIYRMLAFVHPFFDRHFNLFLASERIIATEKIDFVIITGEPFILFRYGYLLHKKMGTKWIPDYRDGWSLNPIFRLRKDFFNRVLQWWERKQERKIIRNCDFITTVDPFYAKRLNKMHDKEVEVVYNGFEDFYNSSIIHDNKEKGLVLTHSGTLTSLQNIEFLLQAIKELNEEKNISEGDIVLQFVGLDFFPGQIERVQKFGESIRKYFVITSRVSKEETLEINAKSDFLISVTEENFPAYYTKTYDYFAVKKPIIVVPGDIELSGLIKGLNAGYSFYTISELKIFLLDKIKLKRNGDSVSELKLDISKVEFFKREKQAAIFTQILRKHGKK